MPKKTKKNYKSYFFLIFFMMFFFLLYVYENIYVIKLGYQLKEKNDELFKLTLANDTLQFNLGKLISLERLDEIARSQLGLKFPEKDEVVLIQSPGGKQYKTTHEVAGLIN